MKKIFLLLNLVSLSIISNAQAPNAIPYQGVARNAAGNILATQNIYLRVSIHDITANGTIVFRETFSVTTNTLGLFSINIGTGTPITGTLASVNWGNGAKFLQVEMNTNGSNSYTNMGTTQFMSVPYALFAGSSATTSHYIGENYGGGMVFYVYDNGQHGLIAATSDQSAGISWYYSFSNVTNALRDGIGAGYYNSGRIIDKYGSGTYAALVAANYLSGGFGDWYLPSKYELNLLYLQKNIIGGFADAIYWSSTESDNNIGNAWNQNFQTGVQNVQNKNLNYHVRSIRAF